MMAQFHKSILVLFWTACLASKCFGLTAEYPVPVFLHRDQLKVPTEASTPTSVFWMGLTFDPEYLEPPSGFNISSQTWGRGFKVVDGSGSGDTLSSLLPNPTQLPSFTYDNFVLSGNPSQSNPVWAQGFQSSSISSSNCPFLIDSTKIESMVQGDLIAMVKLNQTLIVVCWTVISGTTTVSNEVKNYDALIVTLYKYKVTELGLKISSIDSRKLYGQSNTDGEITFDPNTDPIHQNFLSWYYRGGLFAGNAFEDPESNE